MTSKILIKTHIASTLETPFTAAHLSDDADDQRKKLILCTGESQIGFQLHSAPEGFERFILKEMLNY